MKPEYLMLGKPYKDQHIGEYWVSEKLDGSRAFWDGGVSRGLPASEVPYANTVKDYRLNTPPIATGLWSRAGKVIHAPNWWLDELPLMPLDGELYLGPKRFQELRSIVSNYSGEGWEEVFYYVFDYPTWYAFGRPRDINIRSEYTFRVDTVYGWLESRIKVETQRGCLHQNLPFDIVYKILRARCNQLHLIPVEQIRLPWNNAKEHLDEMLEAVVGNGGEGLMLRRGSLLWIPERSNKLLKYKPWSDAEGTVIGFTSGKGKYLGMIGALILDFNHKRLELSGLTDLERKFHSNSVAYAAYHHGKDMPPGTYALHFKVGDVVTFKYRELSDDGIPKEARYHRKYK